MAAALASWLRLLQGALRGMACLLVLLPAHGAGPAASPASSAAPAAQRRVLVIYSYSEAQPWQKKVRQGLQDGLQAAPAGARVELFEEQLDAIRLGEPADTRPMATYLRTKYGAAALDAVIAEGQNASAFLLEHPTLFQGVPGFILNYAAGDAAGLGAREMTFVSMPSDLERAVGVMTQVLAQIRHVVAVTDRTALGRRRTEQLLTLAPRLPPGVYLDVWDAFTEQELYARAAQLRADTAILYLPVFADVNGRPLAPVEVVRRLSEAAAVPVFTHFDVLLGTGAVGGYLVSAQRLGALAAKIALHGEAPTSPEAQRQALTGFVFDGNQLARWGIDEARLPPDSEVLRQQPSIWQAYRWYIAAALALFALESALVATLFAMMRQRNRAISELDAGYAFLEETVEARTRELAQSNQLLGNLTAQVPGTVFQYRRYPDGRACVPYASQGLLSVLELDPAAVRDDASAFFALLHPQDRDGFVASFLASEKSLQPWHHEFRVVLPRQGLGWRLGHCQPEKLDDGSVLWHGLIADITQRKQDEEMVRHLAQHDKLTGLANRALFMDRLEQQVARARRDSTHLALVFLDLNEFKPVNDTYGHAVGDLLLQEAAQRMQRCVRESDTVARIGGDEFVVLLPSAATVADAVVVADKIRHAVGQPYVLAGHRLAVSASLGMALYPQHGDSAELLLKRADAAMYQAKRAGREEARLLE